MAIVTRICALLAILAALAVPAWADTITIKGSVNYRERIALPQDAWLRVTLVKLDHATPVAGASASIPALGQIPIAFELNVHSDVAIGDGSYGLVAEISSGGRTMFRNPVPVPTDGTGPVPIVVNFAPQPTPPQPQLPSAPDFIDTVWTVTSIGGRPVTGTRSLTLSIATDLRAGGSGGCNNFFTEASIEANSISFGPAAATNMACTPEILEQEAAYFAALAAVSSYESDDKGLRLLDAAGVPLVGLVRTTE